MHASIRRCRWRTGALGRRVPSAGADAFFLARRLIDVLPSPRHARSSWRRGEPDNYPAFWHIRARNEPPSGTGDPAGASASIGLARSRPAAGTAPMDLANLALTNGRRQSVLGGLHERHGRWLIILPPFLFLLLFFLIPFAFALMISFADTAVRAPPFTDILSMDDDHHLHLTLNLDNYAYLLRDEVYATSYLYSIRTAFFSTLICLLLGYPMAYAIARTSKGTQNLLLLVIILPFWTSFLLRVYALEGIIRDNGLLNHALMWLGIVEHPLKIMHTTVAVYLGIIYSYLPFMVLPLFATLEKLDHTLLEAASDLGSPRWRAFLDITLPLSMPGVIAGSMLVFIPAIGEFVIPSLLGGPDSLMIGRVLWDEFFGNRDWPVASAVAIAFLVLLVGPIAIYQHYHARELEGSA
jgi:putrescine transport system permease protein